VLGGTLSLGPEGSTWRIAPPEGRLVRPDTVEWVAGRAYPDFNPDEFPAPHRVLLATADGFVDAGEAHLSRYGYSGFGSHGELALTLRERVPYDVWLAAGGYAGFSATEDDVRALLRAGDGQLAIASYDEPTLTLLVNPARVLAMVLEHDDDEGALACDPAAAGDETPEAFTLDNGQVDEFPRERTVSHEQALVVVRAFLAGERSDAVSWRR
jgi:hypothetical protein